MFDAMKRHEVQVLKKAGLGAIQVARVSGVSRWSVRRIAAAAPVTEPDDRPLRKSRRIGRPSIAAPFEPEVKQVLASQPDLPTVEVLHRLRERGYRGGKTALYELVSSLRPTGAKPMVRFEGLAGEFSQHDFGHVKVEYEAGSSETVHFFASRLKFSRWAHVVITPDERVESLVRSLLSGFEDFGGVPLVGVFDNPKTVVIDRHEAEVEWNPIFGQVALDYRFAPELCTPRMANQKGSVENLVGWVKGSFFKVRRFHDREDMLRQLPLWLDEGNRVRPSRATGVPPAVRIAEERRRLRALPIAPRDYALRIAITVGVTAQVEHDGIRYSMPPEAIGMPGTLFLYPDRVRVVARHLEASHPRFPERGKVSFLPEHRASMLAKVSGKRAKLYFQRQQLLELGAPAEALLTEIVHSRPRTWKGDVERLFEALQAHGAADLLAAIRAALARELFGAEYVLDLLPQRQS